MNIHTLAANAGRLTVRIHEPFTVCQMDEENQADWVRIHPTLKRVPGGRLILSVSRDRDIYDEEMLMYASDDGGHSWQEFLNWPTASQRGRHLSTACATLGDGSCVVVAASTGLFATQEPGVYRMPSWRSKDGGTTWGEMEPARVEMPVGEAFDIYDPPSPHRKFFQQWCKVQAPPALQALFEPLGRRRLLSFAALFPLDGSRLLGFFYHSPQWGEPYIVVCLTSDDGGRNWRYLSTPGPFEERYRTENFLGHAVDGLCEPSCTRLPSGDLLLVMRLGSRHPLYAARSSDEGSTWTPPHPMAVSGIWPTVVALGGGAVALCSGRPDVTFSLSLDNGYRWPWTYRFLEDDKPEDPSTRNNTMLEVAPGRLLYMYDHGGYHQPLPPEFKGPRRIVGHFINVEVTR